MPKGLSINSASDLQRLLEEADAEFVRVAAERMEKGESKYGPLKFLGVDTLDEALQELVDFSNYARMMYIKVKLIQWSIAAIAQDHPARDKEGFIPMKEFLQS